MYELLGAYSQQISPEYPVDFAVIEPLLQLKDVEKGAYLFHEGSICDAVGLTQKGCLRSFFLKEGKELTLFFHQEQQTLGDYESLIRQKMRVFLVRR